MRAFRPWLLPAGTFLLVSVPLCWGWTHVDDAYARALAPPLARAVLAVSPDVVYVDHDASGDPVLVLENNRRRPVLRGIRTVAGFTVPVFLAVLAAAVTIGRLRSRLFHPRGALVLLAGGAALVLAHGVAFVTILCYALSLDNRGAVSPALRLAGAFADAVLPFVPFVIAGLVLWLAPPSRTTSDPS